MSSVQIRTVAATAVITMVNEGKLNAFDPPMLRRLAEAIREVDARDDVRAIILTGAGEAFCAGGDVSTMGATPDAVQNARYLTELIHSVPRALRSARTTTIAMINGVAVGAGLDIALACDLRTCCDTAHLAEGYINAGLAAGDGGAWLLPRLVGAGRALELLLTGRKILPSEALSMGLVNAVFSVETLLDETLALAARVGAKPAEATASMKRLVQLSAEVPFEMALELAAAHVAILQTGPEHRDAVSALRNRSQR